MASKRLLKKQVGDTIDDLLGQCFDSIDQGVNIEKAEALMDEVADIYLDIMTRIRNAKGKADFTALKNELAAKHEEYAKKINAL